MLSAVRCWRRGDLRLERIRGAAADLGLPSGLVEREVIFYDTLEAICSLSPVPVALKGGTLISRLYSEYPRFSWDIDLSASIDAKQQYGLDELNGRMAEGKRLVRWVLGRRTVELGKFERDVEKDVFVDLLSVKRGMDTWSIGAPLPTYLRKLGFPVERLKEELFELKNALGGMPFVDSVRITVSLDGPVMPAVRKKIPSLIENSLKPTRTARVWVYPPELCLIEKLSRFSRKLDEIGIRDLLCDFYDMGQLVRSGISVETTAELYWEAYFRRRIPGPALLEKRIAENLSTVKMHLDLFKKRREFVQCEYEWKEYFNATKEGLKEVLRGLGRVPSAPPR